MNTQQGLPIESFTPGDILIPVDSDEQWFFTDGELTPIAHTGPTLGASRKVLPNERFYRLAAAAAESVISTQSKLQMGYGVKAISQEEHSRMSEMLKSSDNEIKNLLDVMLTKIMDEKMTVDTCGNIKA